MWRSHVLAFHGGRPAMRGSEHPSFTNRCIRYILLPREDVGKIPATNISTLPDTRTIADSKYIAMLAAHEIHRGFQGSDTLAHLSSCISHCRLARAIAAYSANQARNANHPRSHLLNEDHADEDVRARIRAVCGALIGEQTPRPRSAGLRRRR